MTLIEQIREAGVVGAGGAGFPTDRKLDCKAEIFLVNGIECEPLLRTDRHVMEMQAERIVRTVQHIKTHLCASRAVIALKAHYEAAAKALQNAAKGTEVEIYLSESFYPAGDEQNLVYSVTGRVVPTGGIPLDVGCVVNNVSTVLNIADAIEGLAVTEKMVTVAGAVNKPLTVKVPVGTPLSKLLEAAGGCTEDCRFIIGGPLMGAVAEDLSGVVTKTTGGLLAIPKEHPLLKYKHFDLQREAKLARAACAQCSMCTQMCPRNALGLHVQPHKAMRLLASGNGRLLGEVNGIFSCCDCGLCTYFACNFGLKPGKAMQQAKSILQQAGIKATKEVKYEVDAGLKQKRVPTERLMARLDLLKYDGDAPFIGSIPVNMVQIPLKMHIGAPDEAVVSTGCRVQKGDVIARPTGMGAIIHASISGEVTAVTSTYIEIRE